MSQHDIEWDQTKQEWICKRCGRASDHVSKPDAECELSQFDCVKLKNNKLTNSSRSSKDLHESRSE